MSGAVRPNNNVPPSGNQQVISVFPTFNEVKSYAAIALKYLGRAVYQTVQPQHLARQAVHFVRDSALHKSDPKVDELLNALRNLKQTQAVPAGLKVSLENLVANPKDYFGDAYDGIPPSVSKALSTIIGKLQVSAALAEYQNELETCIQFLTHVQSLQMGWIQYALSLPSDEGLAYFFESMGLKRPPAAAGNHHNAEAEYAQRIILQSMEKPKEPVPVPENAGYESALSNKLDQTRDTAVKMFLTQLVFAGNWKKTFCEIHSEAQRRVSSGTEIDFDIAFGKVFEENYFSTSTPKSTIERFRYWFHLTVTSRLLKRYGKEVMDRFKNDLFNFLKRTPEQRISDVFATVIRPLHEHMSAYYSYNESLAQPNVVLNTSIDRMNEAHFDALVVNEETIDRILIHFAHILVDKYTPTISLSGDMQVTLDKTQNWIQGIYSSKVTDFALWFFKQASVWICWGITGGFETALNFGLKWKLKRVVIITITSNLYKTGDTAGKTHSRVQHLINQFLMEKLTAFNANGKAPDHAHIALRSSPTTRREIEAVIDVLFSNIPLSMATNNAADLREFFHGGVISKGKQDAFNLFRAKFTPTVSLEILRGMEHFFYDDNRLLSEFVWYTANNIAETMTKDAGDDAQKKQFQAAMNATETEMHKQLRRAVKTAVREGVQTALDPSKKYQRELEAAMDGLRRQTTAFLDECRVVNVSSSDKIAVAWNKLAQAVPDMRNQLQETKVTKIQAHGDNLLIRFRGATEALVDKKTVIESLRNEKYRLEQQRNAELNQIASQIDRAQSKEEKISLLTLLSEKPWIDKEFKPQILDYRDFLMKYIKTTADKLLVDLDKARADYFKREVAFQMNEFDRKIDEASRALQIQIEAFKIELDPLSEWQSTIKSITITPNDVTNLVATGIKFTGLPIEQFAVEAVMACLEELLTFKQRTYHLKGITSRGMQAYNRLRPDRDAGVVVST